LANRVLSRRNNEQNRNRALAGLGVASPRSSRLLPYQRRISVLGERHGHAFERALALRRIKFANPCRKVPMQNKSSLAGLILVMLLVVPAIALSQAAREPQTLIVNGQPGQVSVVQMNGRSWVDVEALARVANGSLSFNGNQITLTLPGATTASSDPSASPAANTGLSKGFLKAGIEAMSMVREWHSALANAIQNGFPIAADWLGNYRNQAATALRLASVAISTDSDQNAYPLLSNEFNNMKALSDQYVARRQSLDYIAPNALANDPLNKKIIDCGHALAAMAANGQFVDDGSCQ
jgi:hypothetical protein